MKNTGLTVKQIDNLSLKDFEKMLTSEDWELMNKLNIAHCWQLLDLYKDGARLSGLTRQAKYLNITTYLKLELKNHNEREDWRDE